MPEVRRVLMRLEEDWWAGEDFYVALEPPFTLCRSEFDELFPGANEEFHLVVYDERVKGSREVVPSDIGVSVDGKYCELGMLGAEVARLQGKCYYVGVVNDA